MLKCSSFSLFFCIFLSLFFFKSNFPHLRALPEQVRQHQRPKNSSFLFFLLTFFGWIFGKTMGHLLFLFLRPICAYFQVMWSNIIKNPLCYFSISSSNSKSPIRQIICVNAHENLQNNFLCEIFKNPKFIVHIFGSAIWGGQVSLGHSLKVMDQIQRITNFSRSPAGAHYSAAAAGAPPAGTPSSGTGRTRPSGTTPRRYYNTLTEGTHTGKINPISHIFFTKKNIYC